jgi:hypothetical protein
MSSGWSRACPSGFGANAMHCVTPSVRVAVNGAIHDLAASDTRHFSLK